VLLTVEQQDEEKRERKKIGRENKTWKKKNISYPSLSM
jgi:hypothetical protein